MPECNCPADRQSIPKAKRVIIIPPDAIRREGNFIIRDLTKILIAHADCPMHGWYEITEDTTECIKPSKSLVPTPN